MGQQISRLDFRERCSFVLKSFCLVLVVGAALWGHPPAKAQVQSSPWQPIAVSGEDIKQDGDIAYMKSGMDAHRDSIKELVATTIEQGKDIARLDTKLTIFFWVMGALVGGQITVALVPKKG